MRVSITCIFFLFLSFASLAQLSIYDGLNQSGDVGIVNNVSTIYLGNQIPGGLNDKISSINLAQGYIATLAENEDGTGEAYTFVAAISAISVNLNPLLNNKVSFIRVLPFRNTLKKGVGNTNNDFIEPLDVSWFYDWGANDVSLPSREYVLHAWGRNSAANPANIANYIAKPEVSHLLSFNEPDNSGQANITVEDALPLHKLLAATGLRIGSPAPTESQAFVWLRNFMAGARAENLKVDYLVIHWYDWGSYLNTLNVAPNPEGVFNRFKAYVERVYAIYGKPIWIKEFNANRNTTSATHEQFIALALPWLEQQPYIERYAYFFPPALPPVDGNGAITNIGKAYRDFNASTPAITKNIDNTELFNENPFKRYEAEDATLNGSNIANCDNASGAKTATAVTGSNRIVFHNMIMNEAGTYNMEVSYNTISNRTLTLRVNHKPDQVFAVTPINNLWCFQGGSPETLTIPVNLLAGSNIIEFTLSPTLDYIQINNSTLPVSFIDFYGNGKPKSIDLYWQTAQEINSKHFEVLKSTDGVRFAAIGKVGAAGNSNSRQSYHFVDNTPAQGANYYKLRQVDMDGKFSYSKSIAIQFGALSQEFKLVSTSDNHIAVSVYSNVNQPAAIMLSAIDGKQYHQRNVVLQPGINYIQIPASLSRGRIGIISLKMHDNVKSIKIIR